MLIYGKRPVEEFIRNKKNLIKSVFVTRNKFSIIKGLVPPGLINIVGQDFFHRKFSKEKTHQEIAADVSLNNIVGIETLLEKSFKTKKNPLFLMLDHITDTNNFGAIIRNAVFFGADGIIIPERRNVKINADVFKTSAGTACLIDFAVVTNLNNIILKLKKKRFWIYGAVKDNGNQMQKIYRDEPAVLILGNEEKGIHEKILEKCDFQLSVAGSEKVESLNVASAAAVMLYIISRG